MADALLHSTAVYLYAYDPQTRAYAQLSDAVVGCALLREGDNAACKLLFYNAQKQPLLELALTTGARDSPACTPQQDHYVTLRAADKFYSLRFKDATGVSAFLSAVAFAKAQTAVTTSASSSSSSSSTTTVVIDELGLGKEDATGGLAPGDVAGLALTLWRGPWSSSDGFFTVNPLDIMTQPPAETIARTGDLRRVRLVEDAVRDDANDLLGAALATEALRGMHKHSKRLVTVVSQSTQQWCIASIELVKVKKATRASASATDSVITTEPVPAATDSASGNDDLVQRMANLSRAGSKGSGLIASLNARAVAMSTNGGGAETSGSDGPASKRLSFAELQAAVAQTYVPGLRPVSGGRKLSATLKDDDTVDSANDTLTPTPVSPAPARVSLAATVFAPLRDTSSSASVGLSAPPVETLSIASEMERLMQEQSDLAVLRQQLEESKRKLQDDDSDKTNDKDNANDRTSSTVSTGLRPPLGLDPSRPTSSLGTTWQSTLPTSSSTSLALSAAFTGAPSHWDPSADKGPGPHLSLSPSYVPTAFSASSSSSSSFASQSLVPTPPSFLSVSTGSTEIESGVLRLQRASTSIESALQDVHTKLDRLLNAQQQFAFKASGRYPSSSSSLYSSSLSASSSTGGSLSSSAMLLKNLEKALHQRDELQEHTNRLIHTREQLESAVETLESQHEALELENRRLLDKLQTGNERQHETFRLELRTVQQQLSHAQTQALAFQDENSRLRTELAAKDELVRRERVQRETVQRQLDAQLRQDATGRASAESAGKERIAALEAHVTALTAEQQQWGQERETLTSQLRTVQSQLQDERVRSQTTLAAAQNEVQDVRAQLQVASQAVETSRVHQRGLEEQLTAATLEAATLREQNATQEYAVLSELLKECMNDLYFHFQDAFDDESEFTGKEIVMALRKILKQNTIAILAKLEEVWQLQAQHRER